MKFWSRKNSKLIYDGSRYFHMKMVMSASPYNEDETFPVHLASLGLKNVIEVIPVRLDEAPTMQFIQLKGMCGLLSFCGAFYIFFDSVIGRKWIESSDGFSKVTSEGTSKQSKMSFEIKYLI